MDLYGMLTTYLDKNTQSLNMHLNDENIGIGKPRFFCKVAPFIIGFSKI